MAVTNLQAQQITGLRKRGLGYRTIAEQMDLSRDAVRNYCVSHGLNGTAVEDNDKAESGCPCCGMGVEQPKRGRRRRFCSEGCRRKWWAAHQDAIRQSEGAQYALTCVHCHTAFVSYGNAGRRYCGHSCFIRDRFWRQEDGREPYVAPEKECS